MGGIPIFSYYLVLLWYRLQYLSLKPYTKIPKISNTGTTLLSGQRPCRYRQHVKLQDVSNYLPTRSELVKKGGTKSIVWNVVGFEQERNGKLIDDESVTCRSCRRRVITRSGNTSNLLVHLKANHLKIYSEPKESMSTKERPKPSTTQSRPSTTATQPTLIESLEKTQKYERKRKKK